ncbi:hypothetical protein A2Z00_00500 [Candidatus Gottesmanbacteria bacterium RBG_13_45_10]|uniref:Glycosyltransferase 2-like domain-containing protein n=1 Tax=Candidatus Gottesmanbacteria bacterium RBG_13_45_10 TaxID=1798370 RepID=A0A1F5ZH00_9BACT|nr:MAG: hypothetical protein A2Z00_00500 [Candidatus Gottesmanbacteria bacterium RBG_13_45_10]
MRNKLTLTIGIPAYNEEANIGELLSDLTSQTQRGYVIQKVIVVSDASTDKTAEIARTFRDLPITVVVNAKRLGKARSVNTILAQTTTDALIILDADVVLKDRLFLAKLVSPITNGKADLCAANIDELHPRNFLEKMLAASMQYKRRVFASIHNGNNIYTCHGRGRAFSKRLYKAIHFKDSANEDAYSYLFCVHHGYTYRYVSDATVWYALPSTLGDHELQSVRFFQSRRLSVGEFGEKFVSDAYTLPKFLALKTLIQYTGKNPFIVPYLGLAAYLNIKSRLIKRVHNTWTVAKSSKILRRGITLWITG